MSSGGELGRWAGWEDCEYLLRRLCGLVGRHQHEAMAIAIAISNLNAPLVEEPHPVAMTMKKLACKGRLF